jgi:hypothetical protein
MIRIAPASSPSPPSDPAELAKNHRHRRRRNPVRVGHGALAILTTAVHLCVHAQGPRVILLERRVVTTASQTYPGEPFLLLLRRTGTAAPLFLRRLRRSPRELSDSDPMAACGPPMHACVAAEPRMGRLKTTASRACAADPGRIWPNPENRPKHIFLITPSLKKKSASKSLFSFGNTINS